MQQSLLPPHLERYLVGTLPDNDCGYVPQSSLWADAERKLWIRANVSVLMHPSPGEKLLTIRRKGEFILVDTATIHTRLTPTVDVRHMADSLPVVLITYEQGD